MITLGFTFEYSDLVVPGVAFPFVSTYIYVQTAGDIVYQSRDGSFQWLQAAGVGYHPISAVMVVASATVNGVSRTTTATNMVYCSAPPY
jgi:hypothetical protein